MKIFGRILLFLLLSAPSIYAVWVPSPSIGSGTKVGAAIAPSGNYAALSEDWMWGGYHSVVSYSDLADIPSYLLKLNMAVFVSNDGTIYTLTSIGPNVWTPYVSKSYVDALINGLTWKSPVLSFETTPPVSPNDGDRYIVIATATGDWVGHETERAVWDDANNEWDFEIPANSWVNFLDDEQAAYVFFDGEWVQMDAPQVGMYQVKVTAADTVGDYLASSLQEGTGILLDTLNPGVNEVVEISFDTSLLTPYALTASDLTQFTVLGGDPGDTFYSNGDGTGQWGPPADPGDAIYYPEYRLFPGLNDLNMFESIKGDTAFDTLSGNTFEPSSMVWHKGLQKWIVVEDEGGIGKMDYDGGRKQVLETQDVLMYTDWVAGRKYDYEGVTIVDETDTNYVFVGAERLGLSSTAPSVIIKLNINANGPGNASANTFWTLANILSDDENNQQLEGVTYIPQEDLPAWVDNPETYTDGLFLATRQSDGKFFLINVPLATSSPGLTLLTTATLVREWYPNLISGVKRCDLSDIHWDRDQNALYILADEDALDDNDPGTGKHISLADSLFLRVAAGDGSSITLIPDQFIGYTVYNLTDGSSGLITANTSSDVTADLTGGSDNDWDVNDQYKIVTGKGHTLYLYSLEADVVLTSWLLPQTVGGIADNPEALGIGQDRNTINVGNDDDTSALCNIIRYDLQVRGDHDLRQRNVTMTYDPGVNDDVTLGYGVGSRWDNAPSNRLWICVSPTDGDANWNLLNPEIITPPATSTSFGIPGQYAYDNNYFYICILPNVWRKTSLVNW